jgi:hypothetical protein
MPLLNITYSLKVSNDVTVEFVRSTKSPPNALDLSIRLPYLERT